tara:strand:- start:110 stop:841 length:732 start_codon:yes stop_codon:yes gene_type:complete
MKYQEYWIGVISSNRPGNINKMHQILKFEPTWYVGKNENQTYKESKNIVESGGLCESRNALLKEAFNRDLICVQLSDDLYNLKIAKNKKEKADIEFFDALEVIKNSMLNNGSYYGGCAPTDNAFYFNEEKPISFDKFIVGDFIMVRPCNVFFDESLKLKEDYDYTLQHLKRYNKVSRCNNILASFKHRTNKGGAVDVRTSELEQKTIKQLHDKWGEQIVLNPRRENEILMKYKKGFNNQEGLF